MNNVDAEKKKGIRILFFVYTIFQNGGGMMDGMNQSIAPSIINSAVEVGIQNDLSKQTEEELRMKQLSTKLIEKGRQDDVQRAVSNEDYRQALYDEFEL